MDVCVIIPHTLLQSIELIRRVLQTRMAHIRFAAGLQKKNTNKE